MRTNRAKKLGYALMVTALLVIGGPAFSATSAGSIKITSPVASSAIGGSVAVDWTWRSGTNLKSTSTIDVYLTNNGLTWTKIASRIPVRDGGISWNASTLPDAPYALRAKVTGQSIRSTVSPLYVDNTKPIINITRPAQGQVVVNDETPAAAVIVGAATLVADARDAFTGVDSVRWLLDDEQIGEGASFKHDFSLTPGQHVLKAVATDRAGNAAEDAIDVIVLPGPTATGALPVPSVLPSELPSPDPSQVPSPDPSQVPSVPEVPDTGDEPEVPNPAPSDDPGEPGTPDPTTLVPTALPTP